MEDTFEELSAPLVLLESDVTYCNHHARAVLTHTSLTFTCLGKEKLCTAAGLRICKFQESLFLNEVVAATFFDNSLHIPYSNKCSCCFMGSKYSYRKQRRVSSLPYEPAQKLSDSLVIYYAVRKGFKWRLSYRLLSFNGNAELCKNWLEQLRGSLNLMNRPKKLLVFLNPFGGKRKALRIYQENVLPLFRLCEISLEEIVTERRNHARDYILYSADISYDGVICVGGDGLFNEILNGLAVRTQLEAGINIDDRHSKFKPIVTKIGIIPGGSTNALNATTQGTNDIVTAVLHILLGDSRGIDVSTVHVGDKFSQFASTAVSYGYLGDTLEHSETLRWLGPVRYTISGMRLLCKNLRYAGTVEFELARPVPESFLNEGETSRCHSDDYGDSTANDNFPASGSATHDESPTSQSIKGEFMHVVGVITPCLCKLAPAGLSPRGHLGDGTMDLLVIERLSIFRNAMFVALVLSPRFDHMRLNFVKTFRVTAFSFTPRPLVSDGVEFDSLNVDTRIRHSAYPNVGGQTGDLSEDRTNLGIWNVDGELLKQSNATVYVRVHRQLVSLFSRGLDVSTVSAGDSTTCCCCSGSRTRH